MSLFVQYPSKSILVKIPLFNWCKSLIFCKNPYLFGENHFIINFDVSCNIIRFFFIKNYKFTKKLLFTKKIFDEKSF